MLEIFEDLTDEESEETPVFFWEYGVDFRTGQLTGEIVEGAEALAVWCYFALNIQRYRFRAFSWYYGSETDELIGKSYGHDYTESEIKRMITECICCHPNISDVEAFSVNFENSKISITFKIITDYGESEVYFETSGD